MRDDEIDVREPYEEEFLSLFTYGAPRDVSRNKDEVREAMRQAAGGNVTASGKRSFMIVRPRQSARRNAQ